MKRTFFMLSLSLAVGTYSTQATAEPSVPLSPQVADQLFGAGQGNILTCSYMASQDWVPPDAQVNALCNEAQIACIRWALLAKVMKKGIATKGSKQDLPAVTADAQLKLRGCQVAMETVIVLEQSLLNAAIGND